MDTKSKESLRRYKKSRIRKESTSDSSSSSNSDTGSSSSYSSSDSERKISVTRRHRKKVGRSEDERRSKREKREHCQKKLEAKRDHLKRKLKEAKLRKRAAAAAAVLSGHSHRSSLSPSTQAKLKKLAERKHLREASKERREREKHHLLCERERMRSRSPSKLNKLRVHLEPFKQHITKSPQRMHHQLMTREKIIIQTRGRERTPSSERERMTRECSQRHSDHKLRTDERRVRERAEREALRDKERAEALARCQERQRERERLAREKLRRQDDNPKKYGDTVTSSSGDPNERPNDFNLIYHHGFDMRERSLDALERTRYSTKRELEMYDHDRNYLESDRFGTLEAGELRHDRDCSSMRRREESPIGDRYISRMRDMHDLYSEEGGERSYSRTFQTETVSSRHVRDRINYIRPRDYNNKDHETMYEKNEHERLLREHERKVAPPPNEWKSNWEKQRNPNEWSERPDNLIEPIIDHKEYNEPFKRVVENTNTVREHPDSSEPDWDVEEQKGNKDNVGEISIKKCASNTREVWPEKHKDNDKFIIGGGNRVTDSIERSVWPNDWHNETDTNQINLAAPQRSCAYRERSSGSVGFRAIPPVLMTTPVQVPRLYHSNSPRLLNKRNMTYTNPNLIKKPHIAMSVVKAATQASVVAAATTAVAAAKAAAQSAANATTNPGILGHVRQTPLLIEKTVVLEKIGNEILQVIENKTEEQTSNLNSTIELDKVSGELSEISDSDDDLLSNIGNKAKTEVLLNNIEAEIIPKKLIEMPEEEDTLDFEEISDGEFEEESRFKNVADALGVDWASLIAESKQQASENSNMREIMSKTAKQRWRTDNLLLNLGISLRMAGECFVKTLLDETQTMMQHESFKVSDVKVEPTIKQTVSMENENSKDSLEGFSQKDILEQPLAFSQVCNRENSNRRNQLFMDICDSSHHALSARQDLQLRRQLCGLPADECSLPTPLPTTNRRVKDLALSLFQTALEVK